MTNLGISPLNPGDYLHGDEVRNGSLQVVDDGCDWSAWLVWSMNARRRISESLFALPPAPQQVAKRIVKKKKRMRRSHKATVLIEQLMS